MTHALLLFMMLYFDYPHAACTAERFFRVDRAQEHLHYVVDICNEDLYILDAEDDSSSTSTVGAKCPVLGSDTEDQEDLVAVLTQRLASSSGSTPGTEEAALESHKSPEKSEKRF